MELYPANWWNRRIEEKTFGISLGSKLILSPHKTQARASYFGAELCQNIKTVYGVADEIEPCSWCNLLKKLKVRSVQCSVQSSRAQWYTWSCVQLLEKKNWRKDIWNSKLAQWYTRSCVQFQRTQWYTALPPRPSRLSSETPTFES